jgi:hypothetical protein
MNRKCVQNNRASKWRAMLAAATGATNCERHKKTTKNKQIQLKRIRKQIIPHSTSTLPVSVALSFLVSMRMVAIASRLVTSTRWSPPSHPLDLLPHSRHGSNCKIKTKKKKCKVKKSTKRKEKQLGACVAKTHGRAKNEIAQENTTHLHNTIRHDANDDIKVRCEPIVQVVHAVVPKRNQH